MTDPVLWAGIVLLAGALGAMAARAGGWPAAFGALAGGFLAGSAARAGLGAAPGADLGLIRSLAAAFVCLLAGASLDLARLARLSRSILVPAAAQVALVMLLASGVGWLLGLGLAGALLLGAGAASASPAAMVAVTSETRARGDLTQRLLALSAIGLGAGAGLACVAAGMPQALARLGGAVLLGVLCGSILLVPLSRMATRAAILACVGAGTVLLVGCSRFWPDPALLAPMSIVAGFLCAHLIPNRVLVRDAVDGFALPASVALFGLAGAAVAGGQLIAALPPALLVLAARGAGLLAASFPARGGATARVREASAMLPMAGASLATPAAALLMTDLLSGGTVAAILAAAALLSELAGTAGTRWALIRSGEGAALSGDPDAWRAPMR